MINLKPCPFCGSEQPQDSKDDGNVPYEFGMSRSCNSCSAAVNLGWNTRPIEDALTARIAELKPIIDKLVEGIDSLTSGFPLEIEYVEAVEIAKDWKKGRE